MKETAIKVENLGKRYQIGKRMTNSLRHSLGSLFSSGGNSEEFWALKDVNFNIQAGDVVGIIGRNGAGKSTLLKILSQITRPTTGRIELHGRVASLLEVGTGFHPELTGRENIYLNGTILGMTRKEVTSKFDEIVDFSGIDKFIDTPVKHYSSGMYVRLGFSVAAHLEPEILIIDEVLAVGDAEFQKKCLGKMQDVAGHGRTVLFVSHNMAAVKGLCNTGIYLKNGSVMATGNMGDVIEQYNNSGFKSEQVYHTATDKNRDRGEQQLQVWEVAFDQPGYLPDSPMKVSVRVKRKEQYTIDKIDLSLFVFDNLQNTVLQLSTIFLNNEIPYEDNQQYHFQIDKLNLSPGSYSVGVWVSGNGFEQDYVESNLNFDVLEGNIYGAISPHISSIYQKEFNFFIS